MAINILKNFMLTMTNTLLQQLTEQVKNTIEWTNSMCPLLMSHFDPTPGHESFSGQDFPTKDMGDTSPHGNIRAHMREQPHGVYSKRIGGADVKQIIQAIRALQKASDNMALSRCMLTPYVTYLRHSAWFKE